MTFPSLTTGTLALAQVQSQSQLARAYLRNYRTFLKQAQQIELLPAETDPCLDLGTDSLDAPALASQVARSIPRQVHIQSSPTSLFCLIQNGA